MVGEFSANGHNLAAARKFIEAPPPGGIAAMNAGRAAGFSIWTLQLSHLPENPGGRFYCAVQLETSESIYTSARSGYGPTPLAAYLAACRATLAAHAALCAHPFALVAVSKALASPVTALPPESTLRPPPHTLSLCDLFGGGG